MAAALHFRGRCRGGAPPATRAAHLVNIFILFDINVLRLLLAAAESTDYDPGKVADGQHSEAIGVAARQRRVRGVRNIQK